MKNKRERERKIKSEEKDREGKRKLEEEVLERESS